MTGPLAVARGRKLWLTALGLAALIFGVQSCDDAPMEPRLEPTETARLNSDPDDGEWEILGPFTIPGGGNYQDSVVLPSMPVATMMEVIVSGFITSSHATAGVHEIGPQGQYVSGNC